MCYETSSAVKANELLKCTDNYCFRLKERSLGRYLNESTLCDYSLDKHFLDLVECLEITVSQSDLNKDLKVFLHRIYTEEKLYRRAIWEKAEHLHSMCNFYR